MTTSRQFVFSLLFKGDATGAQAAAKDAVTAQDQVAAAGRRSEEAARGNIASIEREAQAVRALNNASRERAMEERKFREAATVAQGPQFNIKPENVELLRERFVPMVAAQKAYAKELDQVALAERAGALTAAESAAARTRLKASYDTEVAAIQRQSAALDQNNKAVKLSAYERRILNMQLSDTAQSLALGMPPLQVLLQQGPQITDLYGGVTNTLNSMARAATLGRIAVAGIGATVLIGATAWNGYLKSVKEVDTAAAGLGRGMAGTRQEMEAAALAGAEVAGISVKAARSMEAAFLRTGRIDGQNFQGLIGLSKDFAATIGTDAKTAGAALSEIFADPAKGADILFRQYGLISASTAQFAKDLAEQNRHSEAQAALIRALPPNLADAEAATTALGRAWDFVARQASNAGDAIGGALDRAFLGPTLDQQIAESERRIKELRKEDPAQGLFGLSASGVFGTRPARGPDSFAMDEELGRLADLRQEKRSRDEAEARRKQEAADRMRAQNVLSIAETSPANEAILRERKLRNQLVALQGAQGMAGFSDDQRALIDQSIDAKSHALAGLSARQANQNRLDEISLQLAHERNPLIRAELIEQQIRLSLADKEISTDEAATEAKRARNKVLGEAIAGSKAQSAEIRAELEARQRLNAQVGAGLITSEDANRLLQIEMTLHPLVAAAAAAQGEEQRRLNEVIAERQQLMLSMGEAEKLAAAQSTFASNARRQADDTERMRLEVSLIGRSADERRRALAALEAEQQARATGARLGPERIEQLRQEAVAASDLRAEVERLKEAWGTVDGAAASAIDNAVDSLLAGKPLDAMRAIVQEISAVFSELALKNPLKNAILGSDLPTMADVGGLSGIMARLAGQQPHMAMAANPLSVSTMSITSPMVTINAGGISGLMPGFMGGAAFGGGYSGQLSGNQSVQQQIWAFFAAKGLAPHQIAGIMGNVAGESGFNPLAQGDYRNGSPEAFGLFQWNDRAPKLFDFIGGQGNLGNVQAQLEFAWQELLTSESGALARLRGSNNVYDATNAFMRGFERPSEQAMADSWPQRLAAAEAAMSRFEGTTVNAQAQLGQLGTGAAQLGTGLQGFGASMAGMIQGIGAQHGTGGLIAGTLLTGVGKLIGIPGFDRGGWTGSGSTSDVAGVVHAEEYVFDAAATRRIGVANLEAMRRGAMRGYRDGGFVVGGQPPLPASARDSQGAGPQAKAEGPSHTFNINVTGTGNQEVRDGVFAAIEQAFDAYDRDVLPGRVRMVVKDRWSG